MFEENLKTAVLVHILLRMRDHELFQKKGSLKLEVRAVWNIFFLQIASTLKRIKYLKKQVKVLINHRLRT